MSAVTSTGSATLTAQAPVAYLSKEQVLTALSVGKLDIPTAMGLLAKFDKGSAGGTIKVSEKGAVQMRGVPGANVKFGLTLYAKTLEWLYANRETVEKFIADHRDKLAWEKPAKSEAEIDTTLE